MSAKEFYAKPKPHLPDIPVEIWQVIFREATGVPGPLEVELATQGYMSTADRKSVKLFRASLVTKRYLPRVCKAWYAIASPYLYEQVCTGRGRCLAPLCYALKRSRVLSKQQPESGHLGWWTRRLDVSFRDFDPTIHDLEVLADIIRELPNLTTIVFSASAASLRRATLPTRVLLTLSRCQNLKTIKWHENALCPDVSDWMQFLQSGLQLSTILPPFGKGDFTQKAPLINLPFLTTYFVCPSISDVFGQMKLSVNNLQRLILSVSPLYHDFVRWRKEVSVFSNITRLELIWFDGAQFTLQEVFEVFVEACPHLIRVDLILQRWLMLKFSRFPRSIRELGLRCTSLQAPEVNLMRLFWTLQGWVLIGDGLKFIQLVDVANVNELYKHPSVVQYSMPRIQDSNVKLVDHKGREIRWANSKILPDKDEGE